MPRNRVARLLSILILAYAAFFIYDDGSLGIHNPAYANSLLDNAIAYADSIFSIP